jgi:uncharacterized protein YlxP (DUF503 family)
MAPQPPSVFDAMNVGVLQVEMMIPGAQSLKDKRHVVKSVLDRLRGSFNVSAAEIDHLDLHQRAMLGFAAVSNDARHASEVLQQVMNHLRRHPEAQVLDHQLEVL